MHLPTVSIRAGVRTGATMIGATSTGISAASDVTVFKSYAEPVNGLDEMNRLSLLWSRTVPSGFGDRPEPAECQVREEAVRG